MIRRWDFPSAKCHFPVSHSAPRSIILAVSITGVGGPEQGSPDLAWGSLQWGNRIASPPATLPLRNALCAGGKDSQGWGNMFWSRRAGPGIRVGTQSTGGAAGSWSGCLDVNSRGTSPHGPWPGPAPLWAPTAFCPSLCLLVSHLDRGLKKEVRAGSGSLWGGHEECLRINEQMNNSNYS